MPKKISAIVAVGILITGVFIAPTTQASCGAAFCMVNSDWSLQGIATQSGWRADLRYEYVDQAQPRFGREKISPGAEPRHHDELETINKNLLASLDYAFDDGRGVSLQIPYILSREHSHIHNHRGAKLFESWDLSGIGDIRVIGRRQSATDMSMHGVRYGLKLPTGKFDDVNEDGDMAERSLQPGTGTTDLLLGTFYNRISEGAFASWFAQTLVQVPLNTRSDYRPGAQLSVDVGGRHEFTAAMNGLLQVNMQFKHADTGAEAESKDSGGYYFFLSPGFSYAITRDMRIYGFAQLPLFQRVHGVQLTTDWSAVVGINLGFGK